MLNDKLDLLHKKLDSIDEDNIRAKLEVQDEIFRVNYVILGIMDMQRFKTSYLAENEFKDVDLSKLPDSLPSSTLDGLRA